jgi:hypothetical protein
MPDELLQQFCIFQNIVDADFRIVDVVSWNTPQACKQPSAVTLATAAKNTHELLPKPRQGLYLLAAVLLPVLPNALFCLSMTRPTNYATN